MKMRRRICFKVVLVLGSEIVHVMTHASDKDGEMPLNPSVMAEEVLYGLDGLDGLDGLAHNLN